MTSVTLLLKGHLEHLPPVMSVARVLGDISRHVTVICSASRPETKEVFARAGITVVEADPGYQRERSLVRRLGRWAAFRRSAWQYLADHGHDSALWIGSADTALALGRRLLRTRYVLHILELYDQLPLYRRLLAPYARQAGCVVVPEPCRAGILRVWLRLPQMPHVLPNKPYGIAPALDRAVSHTENRRKLDMVAGRKLILYQAQGLRMDAFGVARAVEAMGPEYVFGVLGRVTNPALYARLQQEHPGVVHFDYMPAPEHLSVTSHAHVGVLLYTYESLNQLFCAPNKVWEYSAFALPMICTDLPMLREQLAHYHAGEAFQAGDAASVERALRTVVSDYEGYQAGARRLYDSVDLHASVQEVLACAAS